MERPSQEILDAVAKRIDKMELKDSGEREEFETGSRRDTRVGKGRFDLIFRGMARAIMRVALLKERGAIKYGENNWMKGMPLSRYLDSALRHLWHVGQGHEDEDHAAQAAWNCLALIETLEMTRDGQLPGELDDLYAEPEPEPDPGTWYIDVQLPEGDDSAVWYPLGSTPNGEERAWAIVQAHRQKKYRDRVLRIRNAGEVIGMIWPGDAPVAAFGDEG